MYDELAATGFAGMTLFGMTIGLSETLAVATVLLAVGLLGLRLATRSARR
jgi:hypothetical protein